MAVLTNSDYNIVRGLAQADGTPKEEYINAGLDKASWKAMIQGIEDRHTASEAAEKAAMEVDAGASLSNPMAKSTYKAWQAWKYPTE